MYSIVIQYFCRLWNDHHDKLGYHLSPYNVITIFLTYSLHCTIHPCDLFYSWKFVPLNPLHLFHPSLHPLPSGNHQFLLCIYESISVLLCLFICFVFEILHVNEIVWYLSFSVWLISLGVIPSRSIRVDRKSTRLNSSH